MLQYKRGDDEKIRNKTDLRAFKVRRILMKKKKEMKYCVQ